jgi:hypothetical protein
MGNPTYSEKTLVLQQEEQMIENVGEEDIETHISEEANEIINFETLPK